MGNTRKGEYGYISREKKKRVFVTLGLFVIPIVVFLIGYLTLGSRNTIVTVISAVGCLPACKSAVGMIMILLRDSIPEEEYQQIRAHEGSLTMAYEMYMTTYDKNAMVDAAAICGNTVVGLITDKKADVKYTESHIVKILRANGLPSKVNLLTDIGRFTERMDQMNAHADSLRTGVTYTPDEKYPDMGAEELIKYNMLAISL